MRKMPLCVSSHASGARSSLARSIVAALLAVSVVGLLSTCELGRGLGRWLGREVGRELRRPDPEVVQAVPSGVLSRHAALRVVFTRARADREVGEPVSLQPFSFTPPLAGTARWTDERTLEFVPARPMPAGRRFRATVSLPKIGGFDFAFTVMRPSLDVVFAGLEVADDDSASYRLDGTVQTADREEPARVEKILRASLAGRALSIKWTHGSDPLLHPFSITGIERASAPGVLAVAWSGRPIGGLAEGRKDIGVPSRRSFEVLDVRAGDGEPRCIEIGFSDRLDDGQDLAGLVRVTGRDDVRQTLNGNRLRLFSLSPWKPSETVTVDPNVRRADGAGLVTRVAQTVAFKDQLPQVRFTGAGVIVPTTQGLTVPIETMNLRAVIVEAFQVFGDNMTQFLQVNSLDQSEELYRVGAVVWRKVIPLPFSNDQKNSWIRHGLDLSPLLKEHPDGMFQLRVSFRQPHVVWTCAARSGEEAIDDGAVPLVQDDPREQEASYWDSYESYESDENGEDGGGGDQYGGRNDPCNPAYYAPYYGSGRNVLAIRNVLISNIGLIAKAEPGGELTVFCTDIRTAQPLAGVKISLQSFQRQPIGAGQTDRNGMVSFRGIDSPSFVVAERSGQFGWLKVDRQSALITSHFDTGGEIVKGGVKGFLYGERGVWRPGDPIFLTFILADPGKTIPAAHPVTLELRDPRGQTVSRQTKNASVDGFYAFATATDPEAPTGSWEARVRVGDRIFSRDIRIESIMPNRLKIAFDVPAKPGALAAGPFLGTIQANWLHGAAAANLKASILLRLNPTMTTFPKYGDYVFDDPTRAFSVEDQNLFDGALDSQGRGAVSSSIEVESLAPGKLSASFSVRVFEESGAFSAEQFSRELSPYKQYVGIRVPKGDAARGMLLVDTDHAVRLALVDAAGNPVRSGSVQAELYKLEWRWWWEKGDENLADFASSSAFKPLKSDKVSIASGEGEWKFQIKYPDWGRYLVRVRDLSSGHSTGKIVYIDWPGWAGRAAEGK
ncbi:MAG: MG2 domain-containing protein, partial [Spirochaetes bacterium]|nr:MG2 domain-containing protein [Spirochaetota bacterium]